MKVTISSATPVVQPTVINPIQYEDKIIDNIYRADDSISKIKNDIMTLIFYNWATLSKELLDTRFDKYIFNLIRPIVEAIHNESNNKRINELCNTLVDLLLAYIKMEYHVFEINIDENKVENILVGVINTTLFN